MPDKGVKEGIPSGFTLRRTFSTSSEVNRIAWSPDGRLLASATRSEGIQLWDTTTGSIQHTLKGFLAPRNHVGDDRLIAGLHAGPRRGPQISRTRPRVASRSAGIFNFSVAWSPDGKVLASGSISSLFLWDVKTGELLAELRTPSKSNKSIAWSPDGRSLASGSDDGNIRLWDLESREVRSILHGHTRDVNSIAWSPDGQTLASASDDATVCLWNSETEQLIYTFTEHFDSINSIAWSPDGRTLASASNDNTIRVWNFKEKRLLNTFEGHTGPVVCIAFSQDGRLLASKSLDGSVQLRQIDTGKIVAVLGEPSLPYGWYSGLSFHPNAPLLATLGEKDTIIRLWKLDIDSLLGIPTIRYTNAKVALVGDSGVGKTGLSLVLTHQPFRPTDSTHGRHAWPFASREEADPEGHKEVHEILLWDLAGQTNYRLIHQLHLDQVALALIVFDFHSDIDPFAGVNYWERVLRLVQHSEHNHPAVTMKRFLVAARIDRGGRNVSRTRIEQFMGELKLDKYFETSAKDGRGIVELSESIKVAIDWQALPKVNSTHLFQRIKDFVVGLKEQGLALDFLENLYQMFLVSRFAIEEEEKLPAEFEICIKFMSSQGLIKQLSFGNYVLLKPELLDYYASALINAVNDEPDGLGTILENKILEGNFPIPEENRLGNKEQEKLLLTAMIEQLISHDIALRESTNDGSYLIFPSQSTRELPEATDLLKKEVIFHFEGPVPNIYATLAVRLSHSSFFKKKEIGKDVITFTDPTDNSGKVPSTYGISLLKIGEGSGELTLSYDKNAKSEKYSDLKRFVYDHLLSRASPGTVRWQPIITCTECGELFRESAVRRRQELGFNTIICSVCEAVISMHDKEELDLAAYQPQVSAINNAANARREYERNKTVLLGQSQAKILKGEYDVFLCCNREDQHVVEEIRNQLKERGIAPWLYSWDIRPGSRVQQEIEQQIRSIPSAVVFVGASGIDRQEQLEIEILVSEFTRRDCSVIPVFLEDAPYELELPPFLKGFQEVSFRKPKQEQNLYSSSDMKLEQETRLQEALNQRERLMLEARDQREHLMVEARDQREHLMVEALNQGKLLQVEALNQGKLLQVEALNQGERLMVEALKQEKLLQPEALEQDELLQEVQKLRTRFQEAQELEKLLQAKALEQDELLQKIRKLRKCLLAEALAQSELLLTEALEQGELLLAEARDQGELLLEEVQKQGERLQAEAHDQGERLLAEAQKLDERLQAEAHDQGELFQAGDQAVNQGRSSMDLLEWGITRERVVA